MIVEKSLYNKVTEIIKQRPVVLVPVPLNYSLHPKNTSLCCIYIRDLQMDKSYFLPIDHPDVDCHKIPTEIFRAYVPSIKDAKHLGIESDNLIDLELLHYYNTGNKLNFKKTSVQNVIERKFWKYPENNKLVPILKLLEYCKNNRKTYIETIGNIDSLSTEYMRYNRDITDVYSYLESNGIHTTGGVEYTQYNLFTSTGRPSNTFNGINYAALNKEDGSRDRFISRFENGMMVEFDFDSYHLRLIANLIGYNLPDESVHEYLGKYYFGKEELTPDDPAVPDEPEVPEVPEDPAEPAVPLVPDDPDVPAVPDDPDVPDDPADPAEPDVPAVPDDPDVPDDPLVPEDPADPDDPAVPLDPAEPALPEDPPVPWGPVVPDDPDDPLVPDDPEVPEVPESPVLAKLATTFWLFEKLLSDESKWDTAI